MEDFTNVISVNVENVLEVVQNLGWGQVLVSFEDEEAESEMVKCVNLVNEIKGAGSLKFESNKADYFDEEYEEWKEETVAGVHRLLWCVRGEKIPKLTYNDLNIEEAAASAFDNKRKVLLNINSRLRNYAKKTASKYNVKFDFDFENGACFDGRKKGVSAYKQIEQAISKKLDSISFDSDEVGIQTIRVYVSQINGFMGKKFGVSLSEEGIITVRLKELDKTDEFLGKLADLHKEYHSVIGDYKFWEAMDRFWRDQNAKRENLHEVDGMQQYHLLEEFNNTPKPQIININSLPAKNIDIDWPSVHDYPKPEIYHEEYIIEEDPDF